MVDSSLKEETTSVPQPDDNDVDDDLMDVRVPSGMILVEDGDGSNILHEVNRSTPQKPDESLNIDDRAILDCWDLSVASHDAVNTPLADNKYHWQAKDLATDERSNPDVLRNWQPKALPLPPWAVDPFETSKS